MNKEEFKKAKTVKIGELDTLIGGLSKPTKMPWFSFSISAEKCIIGSLLRNQEGTPCSDCFAMKGRYRFGKVKKALARRFKAMQSSRWGENIAALLWLKSRKLEAKKRYFRWFDSGDLQSVADLETIVEIAKLVPNVKFWLPTQQRDFVAYYLREFGEFPKNLTVRISSTKIDNRQKSITGLASMVTLGAPTCPASSQGGSCGPCRKCWDKRVPLIIYPKH